MSQKWYHSHAETIAQNVTGLIISFIVLKLWGMSTHESLSLQAIFFFTSYARSYIIRRMFNKWETK